MPALARIRNDGNRPVRAPRRASSSAELIALPRAETDIAGSLHVLTCGSVDDGKSTLIGRMLWDAGALHADQQEALRKWPATAAGTPDFSRLMDGLAAEREQGITIDIAWRYFDSPGRRLVIIDSPGHEQYTRNMATGASHADVAILLVDARAGVKEQTRRHAAILHLMGVARVVLAVNKMDLVDWSQQRFRDIEAEFLALAGRFGFRDAVAIPVSAVLGDNVARRTAATPWYRGPALLDQLQQVPARHAQAGSGFRFPVQMVVRDGQDFRGLAGTVTSDEIAVGAEVVDAVSGRRARVKRVVTMDGDLESAVQGRGVVLQLDSDIDISRGAVLATPGHEPSVARRLDVRLVWLSDEPFAPERGYLLRTATDVIPVSSIAISAHLDLATLGESPASACAANDIAVARIDLGRSAALDLFAEQRDTGTFMLVDPVSGASVAGGIVTAAHAAQPAKSQSGAFQLTREALMRGIGADLPADTASEQELRRRANEVAILMRGAGVAVEIDEGLASRAGFDATNLWLAVVAILSFGLVAAIVLGMI
jgi:bifunctional enzyme CysN/CysC